MYDQSSAGSFQESAVAAAAVGGLIGRVLVAYADVPEDRELARLVDGLLTHGAELLPAARRLAEGDDRRVAGALRDWRRLTTDGPGDGPLANWGYARALARAVRTLRRGLGLPVPETPSERRWIEGHELGSWTARP
ncbi:DUF6415 family natural product biosynthesis protein [Streptomyces sp. NPDC097619]|uniref:DUF6415 family natural product biosynthesis protein n=1 Tax=Streptomyces sp. NPDC097619 TaxID=3157228 RepID=UPI0033248FFB